MKNKILILTISLYITFLMMYINDVIGLTIYIIIGIIYTVFLLFEKSYVNIIIYLILFSIIFLIPMQEKNDIVSDLTIKTEYIKPISIFLDQDNEIKDKTLEALEYTLNSKEIDGEYWEKDNSIILSNDDSLQITIMLSEFEQFDLTQSEDLSTITYYNNDTDDYLLFSDGVCQGSCDLEGDLEKSIANKIDEVNNNIVMKLKK